MKISDPKAKIISILTSNTAKNTFFVFGGNLLTMVLGFVYTVLLVRYLSLSDFGYFSALLSFLLLSSDIADIGIGSSLSRFLPRMESSIDRLYSFLKTAFLLQLCITIGCTLLFILFSQYISSTLFHTKDFAHLITFTAFGVGGSVMGNFFVFVLMARQRFVTSQLVSLLGSAVRVLSALVLILLSSVNLSNVVALQSLAFIILVIAGLLAVGKKFLTVPSTPGDLKKLTSFAAYLGIARALTAVSGKLDVLMIIALTNSVEAGIYSIASRVTSIYPLLSGSFSTVLAPKVASFKTKADLSIFIKKIILATFGLISTVIILMILAEPFLLILFGSEKGLPAVPVFRVLLLSMIFFVGSVPSVTLAIYYLKKPYILTVNSVLQVIIVVVGNYLFIPRFGHFGAAYSLIASYGITLLTTSVLTFYHFQNHRE